MRQLLLHEYSENSMGGFRGAAWCDVQQFGLTKTFMDVKMPDGLPDAGFGLCGWDCQM